MRKANDGDRVPERTGEEVEADAKSLLQGFEEELEDEQVVSFSPE